MQRQRRVVEVVGVPDVLPADRIVDKLQVYFLTAKSGGGDVLQLLYPCDQPGQAFILFEDPRVAARVLQKSSHVLELNGQQYHLKVKVSEKDLPVEATVHLNHFQDETQVRQILGSHGFTVTDLGGGRVSVEGSFLMLKAVKVKLEKLAKRPTRSSSPAPAVSSGAIPKREIKSLSRSNSLSRQKPPHESPSSPDTSSSYASGSSRNHPLSQERRASYSPDEPASVRPGVESFVVDADVFSYADKVENKNIKTLVKTHKVAMDAKENGDSYNITVTGGNSRKAVSELQRFLEGLSKSLRTQEVPLVDMDFEGRALLQRIRKTKHIHDSVLVFELGDRLHLVGPSSESYKLKQKLLGRPVDESGRGGRSFVRESRSRSRSSSLPTAHQKTTGRESGGAVADPSPGGAAGYSPSKYQDDKQSGALSRRSHSESRGNKKAVKDNKDGQDTGENRQPNKLVRRLPQLLNFRQKDIKEMLKINKKRK
ncbi:uncharacterized protein si:dkey-154b15.1 [Mugil cephalus]|uniref:uncharacterized protein si:dkey-154b15.1 n=1 Tax=Mugil cephalus TaxID=48193 RepID=UPI001FB693A6|nr:uncharacterized protein si:dkey-154b15.1 [Mugil cephalus]XP_047460326.1 uncharacterized protein si:dkey-154b15.1 [Mugil cephalus]